MAIAQVGGSAVGIATNTTGSITYSPTPGNIVCLFLSGSVAISNVSVVDSNGNSLAAGTVAGGLVFPFYYTATTGVTSFTASWTTTATVNIVLEEYSGAIGGVNASLAGNTATGVGTTATITVTTQDNNDWVVAGLAAINQVITITVGNQRQASASGASKLKLADNTVASAGSVSITGTLTSATWAIALLELRSVAQGGGGSTSNWLTKAVATGVNKH